MSLICTILTLMFLASSLCQGQDKVYGGGERQHGENGYARFAVSFQNSSGKNEIGIKMPEFRNVSIPAGAGLLSLPTERSPVLLRNEKAGIRKKVGHAEKFIGGFELATMSILIAMPKKFTHWSANWVDDGVRNFKWAFTKPPVWDQDGWPINYVCHPLSGSYYYNSLRSQKASWFQSFVFATAQSFIWEYVIEGVAERPSTQDLIVTPLGGMILGESAHLITMKIRRNGFNFLEKVFVLLFNPMFVLNNGFGPRFNPVKVQQ